MSRELAKAQKALLWFYEQGVPTYERSTAGEILEQAWLYKVRGLSREKAIDAQPTKETRAPSRSEHVLKTLLKYGQVSRRLSSVAATDPQAARALGAAFGAEGASYARHERGRCVALFPLVPSGIALIARSRKTSSGDLVLNDRDRLRIEVELDTILRGSDKRRRELIDLAERQAHALLEHALALWVEAQ